eukprot:c24407_g1_i1 orf=594-857(+)
MLYISKSNSHLTLTNPRIVLLVRLSHNWRKMIKPQIMNLAGVQSNGCKTRERYMSSFKFLWFDLFAKLMSKLTYVSRVLNVRYQSHK